MLTSSKMNQLIHRSTELDTLDFKRDLPDTLDKEKLAELVRDIIAIANTAYDSGDINGYLVFGVEDKTRDPVDISGQILILKSGKGPRGSPSQLKVDEHNLRIFNRVAKDYIVPATRRYLGLNYGTWKHPDDPGALVGVLEIHSQYGPYIVRKAIHKLDQNGRTIGLYVQPGQAWIREGEDKKELLPNEILSMRDSAKKMLRQAKKIKKATKKLGLVFQKWDLGFFEIVDGETPTSDLIAQPLRTRSQLSRCFHTPPRLTNTLDELGSKWYLNHLVIASPKGSGRTTLLSRLATLRTDANPRGRLIQVNRIPTLPNLDEFVEYMEKGLEIKVATNTGRTIVFDLPDIQDNQLKFIHLLGETFRNIRIWATCDPERETDLTQCITVAFNVPPIVMQLPGYLDVDLDFYTDLIESRFPSSDARKLLLGRSNVVFRDVAIIYELSLGGIEITIESQSDRIGQLAADFGRLTTEEQLIVKIINQLDKVKDSAIRLIVSALDVSLSAYQRIIESGLVYIDDSGFQKQVRGVDDLPKSAKSLTTQNVHYLVESLKTIDVMHLGHARWYLAELLLQLKRNIDNPSLEQQLDRLGRRLQGDNYCEYCDAYFLWKLKFCPNCGGVVNREQKKVASPSNVPVPFPNLELLQQGTFDTVRGVSSELALQIQKTLPELQGGV